MWHRQCWTCCPTAHSIFSSAFLWHFLHSGFLLVFSCGRWALIRAACPCQFHTLTELCWDAFLAVLMECHDMCAHPFGGQAVFFFITLICYILHSLTCRLCISKLSEQIIVWKKLKLSVWLTRAKEALGISSEALLAFFIRRFYIDDKSQFLPNIIT